MYALVQLMEVYDILAIEDFLEKAYLQIKNFKFLHVRAMTIALQKNLLTQQCHFLNLISLILKISFQN